MTIGIPPGGITMIPGTGGLTHPAGPPQELEHQVVGQDENDVMEFDSVEQPIRAEDLITPYQIIRTDGKVRSFDFSAIEDNKASSIHVR